MSEEHLYFGGGSPSPESEAAFRAHIAMIEHAQNTDIAAAGPSAERLIAIRTELIRLSHCNSSSHESVVARADAYLSFILNGTPKESTVDGED